MLRRTIALACALVSCTPEPPPPSGPPAPGTAIACPPAIGPTIREDCKAVGDEFNVLDVGGALKVAGGEHTPKARIGAIRAAGALATSLREQRVALCESKNHCQVKAKDFDAEDKRLTDAMRSLLDIWNKRHLERDDEVASFRAQVMAIDHAINGTPVPPPPPPTSRTLDAATALTKTEDPTIAFRADGAALVVATTDAGTHDALRGVADKLELFAGKHVQIKVDGVYAPASPGVIAPGDTIVIKVTLRGGEDTDVDVGLRSIEDVVSTDTIQTLHVEKNHTITAEVTMVAPNQESGFSVVVGAKGDVTVDDVEASRGGKLLVAARAEADDDKSISSTCVVEKKKKLAGKASFHCEARQEIVFAGPGGHLEFALSSGGGDLVTLDTASLEGGRTLDAKLTANASLVVRLAGPGSATIRSLEIEDVK